MSKAESWKAWEGRTVEGKFPLRQYLGGSDHSAVFLTEMPGTKSGKAAIKLIETKSSDRDLARIDAAAKLSHPHLVRIFATGRCSMDGAPFVYAVMEYADEDLSQILPHRPLTPDEVSDLLPPVLDALTYLHGRGMVHSRVKPSNVYAVAEQLKLSSDSIVPVGPPNPARKRRDIYDAPETAEGILLQASDVWSVGVTMVEALTQRPIAEGTSSAPGSLPEAIADPYRGIVRECLQVDPKRRCSVAEIYTRLQPEARSVPHQVEPPATSAGPAKRRPGLWIVLAAAAVVLIALGVYVSRGKNVPAQNSETTPSPAAQSTPSAVPAPQPAETPKKTSSSGEVVHQVIPEVPQSAQNTITGTIKVTVRVEVDASGKVTAAKFKSSGSSRYFADRALGAAQEWQFSAPIVDGQPTQSTWLIHFRLRRTSFQASAERVKR